MTEPNRVDCSTVLGGISAYLDGELDSTACDVIEQHCGTCASCASVVKGLRDTIGLCRGAAAAPIPESVLQRAKSRVSDLMTSFPLAEDRQKS